MIYNLPNGDRVQTFHVHTPGVEFVTTNAEGRVISTVRYSPAEAAPILRALNKSSV